MEFFIFIGIFVAVILGTVFVKYRQGRVWKEVAQKLGLGYVDADLMGHPKIYGKFRGTQVSADIEVVQGGNNKQIWTNVSVPLGGKVPRDLEVYREGLLQKMGKVVGGEDIQVGDPEIDDAFIIKGSDPQAVRELLTTPSVKRALLIGQKRHPTLKIDYGGVRLRQGGRTTSAKQLESYIRTVVEVSICIEQACGDAVEQKPKLPPPAGPFGRSPETAEPEPVAADDRGADGNDWW